MGIDSLISSANFMKRWAIREPAFNASLPYSQFRMQTSSRSHR